MRTRLALAWDDRSRDAVRFLHEVARSSDALCRVVCECFDLEALEALLRGDSRLPKATARAVHPPLATAGIPARSGDRARPARPPRQATALALHALYLTLMADQPFKRRVATAYAAVYAEITADYARGVGVAEHALYTLSVQSPHSPASTVTTYGRRTEDGEIR